ncbi:phytoene/squalene synthase family protein [Rhizobium glycinendophyticum]|uniref:Phytoene/squalene synthase family protein n=1 Tax=Rhizobium glycinendophyticum TaxID=2589807 RepID=A0A504U799_9HYPH|nr:phytoene/squalene synthase family protein [Rhizobium glycinendophyticum]TPP10924.1 phytoene/squalene synthase family protein [Rhizobium glycinendophyticum]
MSELKPDNEALCLAALREYDRDRYLASLLTPAEHRAAVVALYAYNAELARVRDLVREPLPGEVRLQYWRDLLEGSAHGETAANPVAAELLRAVSERDLPIAPLIAMADARIFDLYDDPIESTVMFEGYAGETSAALIQLAALALDPKAAEGAFEIVGHAGVALAVAGSLLLMPIHRSRGQVYVPLQILSAAGLDRDTFLTDDQPARLKTAIEAFAGYGLDHLKQARTGGAIPKSLLPAFLPVSLASGVLQRAASGGAAALAGTIRAPQWRRQLAMMRLLVTGRL